MSTQDARLPGTSTPTGAVRFWTTITLALVVAIFSQSVFAGFLLSGDAWGRTAHGFMALGLVAATLLAAISAALLLRGVPNGRQLALWLLALAFCLIAQMIVGRRSAEGEQLLWLHVPLGVALVGLAVQPVRVARRLA